MKSLKMPTLVIASMFAFTQPAQATEWSAQDLKDAECIALYASTLGGDDEKASDPGLMGLLAYFVGKVEGRHPGFDLAKLLSDEVMMRVEKQSDEIGMRCAEESLTFGQSLMSAGEAITKRADK